MRASIYKFRFVSSELKDDVKKYLDINEDECGGSGGSPAASELSALSGGSEKGQGTDQYPAGCSGELDPIPGESV